MRISALLCVAVVTAAAACAPAPVYAQTMSVFTDAVVYTHGEQLNIFGQAFPGETIIVRLIAPDNTVSKFEQITTNDNDGTFADVSFSWPLEEIINFPYGTYTVEAISTQHGLSQKVPIKFSSSSELVEVPIERTLDTTVFVPETVAVNTPIRVFVQTTSDGLLVGENNPDTLLQTSHVHLPDGHVDNIASSFVTLHNGLYFVDYTPVLEGTYVFHAVAFSQGRVSHGSAATTVISQDLVGISEEIDRLNAILDETAEELEILKSEVGDFGTILDKASTNIDSSVTSITSSVRNTEEASAQLNALLFPVVSSIGIIVALQLVILARRR